MLAQKHYKNKSVFLNVFQTNGRKWYLIILIHISLINVSIEQFFFLLLFIYFIILTQGHA